jgi:hypothetical protein
MSAAIAGFAAFASAEVLFRLAIGNVEGHAERVLFPLASAGLAASLCVLAAVGIATVGARRTTGTPRASGRQKP